MYKYAAQLTWLKRTCCGWLLVVFLSGICASAADPVGTEQLPASHIENWSQVLDSIAADLQQYRPTQDRIDQLNRRVNELLQEAEQAKKQAQQALQSPRSELEALGSAPEEGEPAEAGEISQQRQAINKTIATIEARIKQADLAITRGEELLLKISNAHQTQLQTHLLQRGPVLFSEDIWKRAGSETESIIARLLSALESAQIKSTVGDLHPVQHWLWIVTALIMSVLLLWPLPRFLLKRYGYDRSIFKPTYAQRTLTAFIEGLSRGLLPAAAILLIGFSMLKTGVVEGLLYDLSTAALAGLTFFIVLTALFRAVLAPDAPSWRLLPISAGNARRFNQRLMLLNIVCTIILVIYLSTRSFIPYASALDSVAKFIVASVIALLLLTLLEKKLWRRKAFASELKQRRQRWTISRWSLALLLLLQPVIALFGYTNLALFIVSHLLISSLLIGAGFLLRRLLLEFNERLLSWYSARNVISSGAHKALSFWLKIAVNVLLGLPLIVILAVFWGVPQATLNFWLRNFLEGIRVGELAISPGNILAALAVFITVLLLTRLLQRLLRKNLGSYTHLDAGVRHSVATGAGYLGIIVAALLTIAVLGVSLTHLALIFGALSIGIGLGLQNVVNNFVSGLVLLIQRPIKVGDWIVVDHHEGYVKNIEAIATELETFDHASVIIPNSDMVSSNVVNWTHKDRVVRVSVKVGVAYDSDIEQVRAILLDCAARCEAVLEQPEARVLFIDFGPSSLDFELQTYINDADHYIEVASELRFMIAAAFRQASITLPFPQQDVHIKNDTGILPNSHLS